MNDAERDELKRRQRMTHEWHVAINQFHCPGDGSRQKHRHWMYEAKSAFQEVPRLIYLHRVERLGKLPAIHQHCSHSPTEPVPDNHLACCLGVECRKCPELAAIDKAAITPDEKDEAKAWTCAAHILMKGGDVAAEGYLLTVDDRMFWERTYASLAMADESEVHNE